MSSVLIVAGENSGDKHGANLVQNFKSLQPSISFYGIGGDHMAKQGVSLVSSIEELAVVGIFEVISHLPRIRKIFRRIETETLRKGPAAAVLIDSPDFNLRLAKRLKDASIPVLYYIGPTVWAWRKKRLKKIKKVVDKMLLIFPFEEKIYADYGIPAVYVGHPLKERVKIALTKEEFIRKYGLDVQKKTVSILPGSRKSELKFHIPVLAQTMKKLHQEFHPQFLLPLAENLEENFIQSHVEGLSLDIHILRQDVYEALAYSDIALSSCGTANLEAALLGTPAVAFYRISPLTYHVGIKLMKIRNFSIVNILAGKKIIPELIQRNFTADKLAHEARQILNSGEIRSEILSGYEKLDKVLGEKKASENAACQLNDLLKQAGKSTATKKEEI